MSEQVRKIEAARPRSLTSSTTPHFVTDCKREARLPSGKAIPESSQCKFSVDLRHHFLV